MRSIAAFLVFLAGITGQRFAAAQAAEQPPYPGGTTYPEETTSPEGMPSPEGTPYVVETDTPTRTYRAPSPVSAKGDTASFLAYDFGVPLGSVRDFSANVSPVGVELQFRGWVMDQLSLGLSVGWSSFVDERSRSTFTVENAAITASAYNRMQMTNARLLAHYYLSQGNIRPYIGPNIGLGWTWFELEAADLVFADTQFSMNFGGELGAVFGDDPAILANLRYSWIPGADFLGIVSNVQTVSAQVGIGL